MSANSQTGKQLEKVVHPGRMTTEEKKKVGWLVAGPIVANLLGSMAGIALARWIWRKIDGRNPPQVSQTTGFIANAAVGFNTR